LNLFSSFKRIPAEYKELFEYIKALIGKKPGNIKIYAKALKHKSLTSEESNERLEFLGDSVLSTIISEYVYFEFPNKNEGDLTKLRAKIVSRENLNMLAQRINIKEFLKTDVKIDDTSSIYGNALEALIGSIYLDKGYRAAYEFVANSLMKEQLKDQDFREEDLNFKSKIIEFAQREKKQIFFAVQHTTSNIPLNRYYAELYINDVLAGKGTGPSKKRAEQYASKDAWKEYLGLK
jgi:ribonuclease-3